MQTENAEMRLSPPMPMCARFDYGLGSIIQLVARTCKSARQAGGHLRKCFCDHHFDKAIFPTTHSPLRSGKMAPSLSTFSHLHTYRLSSSSSSSSPYQAPCFPLPLFPRQIIWWAVKIGSPIFCGRLSYVKGSGERRRLICGLCRG